VFAPGVAEVIAFPSRDPEDVAVGARLAGWRAHRGLSLCALSEASGLSESDLDRAEHGRLHLGSHDIYALTMALHLPLWALSGQREYR